MPASSSLAFMSMNRLFAWLQHRIEPPQNGHRQNDVTVFAAHIKVAQDVIGNAPDEIGDPAQIAVAHVPTCRTQYCLNRDSATAEVPIPIASRKCGTSAPDDRGKVANWFEDTASAGD